MSTPSTGTTGGTAATGGTGTTPPAATSTDTTTPTADTVPATEEKKEFESLAEFWESIMNSADMITTDTESQMLFVISVSFIAILSLFVLVSTGSIVAVLVLWVLSALLILVLIYYGFIDVEKILGALKAEKPKKEEPKPTEEGKGGGPSLGSEVFYVVYEKNFTYEEAPAVCAAYGAELATLEQIIEAYNGGAEWCGYGWSAGGMALYPTQKATWDELQREIEPHRRTACGRPGVNGGYFDPMTRFGVNCFGFKPKGEFKPPAPLPGSDTGKFKEMVNKFKNMLKALDMSPWSRKEWSGYDSTLAGRAQKYGEQFKQELGMLKEKFEPGDPEYVESLESAGSSAYSAAPYGLMGDTGPTGPVGPKGPIGPQGIAGPLGPRGIGDTGPMGPQGTKGDKGDKGDQGLQGTKGDRGVYGAQGPPGAAGSGIGVVGGQGPKGDTGATGATGPQGPEGQKGATGATGATGPATQATIPKDLVVDSIKIGNTTVTDASGLYLKNGNNKPIRLFMGGHSSIMTTGNGGAQHWFGYGNGTHW